MSDTEPALTFEVLTLFPDAIERFVQAGLLGKAIERGTVAVRCTDIRDFTTDKHRTVDDAPFGGGAGMVIKPEPVVAAIESVEEQRGPMHRILLTPSAPRFDQRVAQRLAGKPRIGLLCGRYGGVDDRVREHYVHECLSLGDFILGGGEVAALAIIEAVSRLTAGVLGNPESLVGESFGENAGGPLLEHPVYTRPAEFCGHRVPEVLLGGDHAAIRTWRHRAALQRTWTVRPELREPPRLPTDTRVHVAIGSNVSPSTDWLGVLRPHGVASLIVLGDAPSPTAWAEALQGRVQLAAFGTLAMLRKRMRPRGDAALWVVAVYAQPPADDAEAPAPAGVFSDITHVVDALRGEATPERATLVLWAAEDLREIRQALARGHIDAVYAPQAPERSSGQKRRSELETGPEIADASRPPTRLVDAANRALTHLQSCR